MPALYSALAGLAARMGSSQAHALAAAAVRLAGFTGTARLHPGLKRTVMGLEFPSPVGLAAGFDKHGALFPYLARLGLGFAEIGTATPQPETGRSRGMATVMSILSRHAEHRSIPLGVSISMNRSTPPAVMANDYETCMRAAWHGADYLVLNLGVRAGPDLHRPEYRAVLRSVFDTAKREQSRLTAAHRVRLPVMVKIDASRGNTHDLIALACERGFDGLVLGGGAISSLERIARELHGIMPVVSVGGIRTPQDAADRLNAGAALVQLHTGLVKSGPRLVRHINAFLDGEMH